MPHILTAFDRYPDEAAIIGRMMAGYGELEFGMCLCMSEALGSLSVAARVLFRSRGEEHRISTADAILYPWYESFGISKSWEIVRRAISWCKGTRNQYSHCHWRADELNGLFFTHIEKGAKSASGEVILEFLHVDVPLLEQQEDYFHFAQQGILFIRDEQRRQAGQLKSHDWKAPEERQPPPRHNPPEKHPIHSTSTDDEMPPK
jgi:hypothetical protein